MAAFESGTPRIRAVCAEVLDDNGGQPVVLRSELFRVAGLEPDEIFARAFRQRIQSNKFER